MPESQLPRLYLLSGVAASIKRHSIYRGAGMILASCTQAPNGIVNSSKTTLVYNLIDSQMTIKWCFDWLTNNSSN